MSYLNNKLHFLVVDENLIIRKGLKMQLSKEYAESIVDEADNKMGGMSFVCQKKYDLIILGINCDNEEMSSFIIHLKQLDRNQKIIVFNVNRNLDCEKKYLDLGVSKYLPSDFSHEDVSMALEKIFPATVNVH